MKLLLHILRKDARRLWLPLGVTLVLLGVLAHDDGWRSDSMPGLAEGWLNLLLPLAWALLAALAVHEESLVGDREFWTTRPHMAPALRTGANVPPEPPLERVTAFEIGFTRNVAMTMISG